MAIIWFLGVVFPSNPDLWSKWLAHNPAWRAEKSWSETELMFAEVLTERSELPWSTGKKKKKNRVTVLNRLSVWFKELLVDTLAHRKARCRVQVALWVRLDVPFKNLPRQVRNFLTDVLLCHRAHRPRPSQRHLHPPPPYIWQIHVEN